MTRQATNINTKGVVHIGLAAGDRGDRVVAEGSLQSWWFPTA